MVTDGGKIFTLQFTLPSVNISTPGNIDRILIRLIDIIGSTLGLIIFSIFFFIIAILIKLDSKGPVFYTRQCIGKNRRRQERRKLNTAITTEHRYRERREKNLYGKPFTLYKFRTMREDAERKCGPVKALKNDPRTTNLGRVLRKTGLDELPLLVNILKGEMSFVGPSPERPYFASQTVSQIQEYLHRFNEKPGLTGLAQIKKSAGYPAIKDDLFYCQNINFKLYISILLLAFRSFVSKR